MEGSCRVEGAGEVGLILVFAFSYTFSSLITSFGPSLKVWKCILYVACPMRCAEEGE
jgi:hypothetical protein